VRRYRTEIVVPPDRYVCLQLPADFPDGHATISVVFHPAAAVGPAGGDEGSEVEDDDIEWWEEFDDDPGPSPGLSPGGA
jgi:hypothetical protein